MIKTIRPSVTIGIPAHNEGKNIKALLLTILNQVQRDFEIKNIIVISDASSDTTVSQVKSLKNQKIQIFENPNRSGKSACINQIFAKSRADIVVIFDADIKLPDQKVLQTLLTPMITDSEVKLVSGYVKPISPQTFAQHIAYMSWHVWDLTKKIANQPMYFCEGAIRAFAKPLYKQLVFPSFSADDVYPYLYCQTHSLKYYYKPEAYAQFVLPATLRDYFKQNIRYLHSQNVQEKNFDKDLISKSYTITMSHKLRGLWQSMTQSPGWTLIYIGVVPLVHLVAFFDKKEVSANWTVISSTKDTL
ncbi:glycosyltransferase family 2 protein [Candidatus Beckwithbacteria bacterium]|nr:glycosyltransferase family 2 protein [Candidatus Beckwithbacteria bacterium]